MKNANVNTDKLPQQPEATFETTVQIPKLVTEWKKKLNEEFESARDLASNFYNRQVEEMNDIIFYYLHKPDTLKLALCLNEYQLDLFKVILSNGETKSKAIRIWSCNHPIQVIEMLSPQARKEYYRACIELLQAEYGYIQWKKIFLLQSEEKEETSPQTVTKEESHSSTTVKTATVVDDIELIFSRRGQVQQ